MTDKTKPNEAASKVSRRRFVKAGVAGTAAVGAAGLSPTVVRAASDPYAEPSDIGMAICVPSWDVLPPRESMASEHY